MSHNKLGASRSPFLQHGAHQPVHWRPWGADAFQDARAADKPILLDIGAVWCHWCHVMDRESYENEETAALINELFIPVKVDRDESPDVDSRYQRAVQLLTGGGGWPLTAFLTHEGDVFYGGTYFPPVDAHGRPSFRRVLAEVHRVWTQERARALDAARGIDERLATYARAEAERGDVDDAIIDNAVEELARTFDFRYGGFGAAPKFPHAGALDILTDAYLDDGADWMMRMAIETLEAMGRGGIYDQIGGGFHRYATDARWLIPHFEKMAYDNGVLLQTYARAAVAYGNPFFREIALGIVAHYEDVSPDLLTKGGFPASQDADFSSDDDGDYWTWTSHEIKAAMEAQGASERAMSVIEFFGVDDSASAMHIDPSRHVLYRAKRGALPDAAAILKKVRDTRDRPFVDETLYAGWVSLVASGHIAAARYLGHDEAGERARRALERIHRDGFSEGKGLLHRVGDRVGDRMDDGSGFVLDDQAQAAIAYIDMYELSGDDVWLERAALLLRLIDENFSDESGAFRDRLAGAEVIARPLAQPHLTITDSPTPSGNGSAALALLRYAALTGSNTHQDRAVRVLEAFGKAAARFTSAASTYLKALSWVTRPVTKVVITGDASGAGRELHIAALRSYRPRTVVRWLETGAIGQAGLPPEIGAMIDGQPGRAYVCVGQTCSAPVSDAAALTALLRADDR